MGRLAINSGRPAAVKADPTDGWTGEERRIGPAA
jgi:hypothetical protein